MAETTISRGEEPTRPVDQVKDWVKGQLEGAMEKAQIELVEEPATLTPPGSAWEIWAFGPFNNPGKDRVIKVGEQASVIIAVWMNDVMLPIIEGYESHIGLDVFTSNIQTMTPVPGLSGFAHIDTTPGGAPIPVPPALGGGGIYLCEWRLTPQEAACLYEANICVKITNCKGNCLPDYTGFARQVFDFDAGHLFPFFGPGAAVPGMQFNNPVRFMVYPEACSIDTSPATECPLITP